MPLLRLVPILLGPHVELLPRLVDRVGRRLSLTVEVSAHGPDPEIAFDRARGQYNSRLLLAQLLREPHSDADRVLGLTSLDLFIPVLTFVFGEAQLCGRAAIVSSYRLDNTIYGLPGSKATFFDRLCKECIHELGHTLGLAHCPDSECVMTSSMTVDGVDMKSDAFCDGCLRQLSTRACV